eukprot:m.164092 g.164092  ORF g.164092 m.164092 type:complete len:508 (+) comp17705_c0_seq5:207-1730(+)
MGADEGKAVKKKGSKKRKQQAARDDGPYTEATAAADAPVAVTSVDEPAAPTPVDAKKQAKKKKSKKSKAADPVVGDEGDGNDGAGTAAFVFGQDPVSQQDDELAAVFATPAAPTPAPVPEQQEDEDEMLRQLQEEADIDDVDDEDEAMETGSEDEDAGGEAAGTQVNRKRRRTTAADSDDEDGEQPKPNKAVEEERKEDPERLARTIFVGNLPATCSKKQIRNLFKKYGAVEAIRLRNVSLLQNRVNKRAAVILRQQHASDKSTMTAYIVFLDKESAEAATASNQTEFMGHHLRVDLAASSGKFDPKKSVFVGNLPFDATEEQVIEFFSECGSVQAVRIVRDKSTSIGKGFCYVLFANRSDVSLAITKNGSKLGKRNLRITHVTDSERLKEKRMATDGGAARRLQLKPAGKGNSRPGKGGKPGGKPGRGGKAGEKPAGQAGGPPRKSYQGLQAVPGEVPAMPKGSNKGSKGGKGGSKGAKGGKGGKAGKGSKGKPAGNPRGKKRPHP